MHGPVKAKKTRHNQPADFQEAAAAAMLGARSVSRPRLNSFRLALAAVWLLATIAAGVGVGLLLRGNVRPGSSAAPAPVAQASVKVVPANTGDIGPAVPAAQSLGATTTAATSAAGIQQAGAGSPFRVLGTSGYQPADTPNALQPGFATTTVHAQGNIGTQPVHL